MSYFSFKDHFKKQLIGEDTPVSGEYDTWYPTLRTGVSTRSQTNDVYLFKDISQALNLSIQGAVDHVSTRLFNKLFPNNQPNPANTEDEYRDAIFNALTEIVDEINREAGTRIKNSKSQKNYTARIISSLGQAVKTFNGIRPQTVRAAVQRANREVVREEPETSTEEEVGALSEIDKLKTRLFKDGYGNGLELTANISKKLYGIKDPGSINLTTKLKLLKTATEQAKQIEQNITNTEERIKKFTKLNNFYGGVFERRTFGQELTRRYFSKHDHDITLIKENVLRFSFSFQESVENKLISSSGIKFINHLIGQYNVTPVSVFKHFVQLKSENGCFIFNCVPITTSSGRLIYYTERQRLTSKTGASDRSITCPRELMSISRFYSAESRGNYAHSNLRRHFYLDPQENV